MIPLVLIMLNFLRQNRWIILLLILYPIFFNVLFGKDATPAAEEDVSALIRQEAVYVQAMAIFLAASVVFNERRSRRILCVLSKGISRFQYLTGLLLGVLATSAAYVLSMTLSAWWVASKVRAPVAPLWIYAGLLLSLGLLSASVSFFFGSFTHPAVASALSAGAVASPLVMAIKYPHVRWLKWIPQTQLLPQIFRFSFLHTFRVDGLQIVLIFVEFILIYAVAVLVFYCRDLTIASE